MATYEEIQKEVTNDKLMKDANRKIDALDRMVEDMRKGYFCIFAGAGLSAASGYVDWKTLLEPMGRQLGLNMNMDLTLLAQYYANKYTRHELNRRILEEFAKIPKKNDNMELLAEMPIKRYWTTNYDSVIEDTLRSKGKIIDVVIDPLQFKYHSPDRDAVLFKMHGDKTLPDKAVLCKKDYEMYDENRGLFTQGLILDLINNTFLFIGFSFSDPNLDRIISLVKRNFKEDDVVKHYCFLRKVSLKDYVKECIKEDKDYSKAKEQYEQDMYAQECKIQDMMNYGIETILVDDFAQITEMLIYMKDKLTLNSVFISGGRDPQQSNDYGNFEDDKYGKLGKAKTFMMHLGDELIMKNYNIVTGFGAGVGNYIVAGAYSKRNEKNSIKLEERVYIQPMISIDDDKSDEKRKVREDMLKKCGIVITLFGKNVEGVQKEELEEDGTYIEYVMAKQSRKIIIPVGATGFTSKIIYDKEELAWKEAGDIYSVLGDATTESDALVENIIRGIEMIKRKKEARMRNILTKNVRKSSESIFKKVFLSFHYSSSFRDVENIINIIEETEHYYMSRELEKCEEGKIREWISDKLKDATVTIVFYNEDYSKSKWTDYEVNLSVKKEIPFLFLVKEDKESSDVENYIKEKKIEKATIMKWESIEDFKKIPEKLDMILNETTDEEK